MVAQVRSVARVEPDVPRKSGCRTLAEFGLAGTSTNNKATAFGGFVICGVPSRTCVEYDQAHRARCGDRSADGGDPEGRLTPPRHLEVVGARQRWRGLAISR